MGNDRFAEFAWGQTTDFDRQPAFTCSGLCWRMCRHHNARYSSTGGFSQGIRFITRGFAGFILKRRHVSVDIDRGNNTSRAEQRYKQKSDKGSLKNGLPSFREEV